MRTHHNKRELSRLIDYIRSDQQPLLATLKQQGRYIVIKSGNQIFKLDWAEETD